VTKKIVLVLTLITTVINILGCGTKAKRERPFSVGEVCPDIKIDYALSSNDAYYLGVSEEKSFSLEEISARLLVVEVLNVYCSRCRSQAPVMRELFHKIQSEPYLKDNVKILALAVGNQEWEIKFFKKTFDVPYPMIPDAKFELSYKLGVFKAPYHLVIKKDTGKMIVAMSHKTLLDSSSTYFESLSNLLTLKALAIRKKTAKVPTEAIERPDPIISEEELFGLIKSGAERNDWEMLDIEEIKLKNAEIVYMVKLKGNNTTKNLFAKMVSRTTICDSCEDVHFIYLIDDKGKIVALVPINLAKDGNKPKPWHEHDIQKTERRVVGRYIYESIDFDARVDAVSTATVTSAIVFDSLDRAAEFYLELKKRGYIN